MARNSSRAPVNWTSAKSSAPSHTPSRNNEPFFPIFPEASENCKLGFDTQSTVYVRPVGKTTPAQVLSRTLSSSYVPFSLILISALGEVKVSERVGLEELDFL